MRIPIVRLTASAALVFLLGMASCSDSENRHLALLNQAKVIIDLGMPEDEDTSSASIIDRVLRIFAADAIAQTAPARFSAVTVSVTGPNLTPVEKTFTAYGDISFNVPAGSLRHFEVTAVVAARALNAARSFRGTTTANLPAGATVNVPVLMGVYETKLVVPDRNRNRLYILNTILDDTPTIINTAKLDALFQDAAPSTWTTGVPMYPNDIDFDARGRIYFCANQGTTDNYLIRIDNEDGASSLLDNISVEILSIAIDRKRNTLYYGTSNALYYVNLKSKAIGTVQLTTDWPGLNSIRGIAVDEAANYLYLACSNGINYGVLKQNPDNASDYIWMAIPDSLIDDNTFDVMIKRPYVYATWYNTVVTADNGILQFSLDDLSFTGTSLTIHDTDSFLGPRRFIAKHNRGFMVMDESPSQADLNRLVGFLTFDGLGWYPYQPPAALAPFGFY